MDMGGMVDIDQDIHWLVSMVWIIWRKSIGYGLNPSLGNTLKKLTDDFFIDFKNVLSDDPVVKFGLY